MASAPRPHGRSTRRCNPGPRVGDPELLHREALEKLEAQSDPLINLVGHVERERPYSAAFEDPRFVEWLSNEARATGRGAPDALGRGEISALATRILESASAERLGVYAARGRVREIAHDTPAPVSQHVDELHDRGRTGVLDLAAAAGVGRELWDAVVDTCVELPPGLPKAHYLALKVAGESMQPLLHTGDTILVRLGGDVKPDTVVVALVPDSGYVVKRAGRVTRASLELLSLNPEYGPMAVYDRETDAGLVHHSDRGSQYLSIRYTERLAAAGIEASVGSRGDAYDNALAESVIGLFKTEVIRHAGPWRSLDDVEYATLEWVAWFNTSRLLEPLGYLPPAEYERQFEQRTAAPPRLEPSTT